MSFRKKIILSQIIAFIICFAVLLPFIEEMAFRLVKDSLIESTTDLKDRLPKGGTEEELIDSLKKQEYYAFFRMSIINDKGLVIFDTHFGSLLGKEFKPHYPNVGQELEKALEKEVGYVIAESETFKGRFAYVTETFPFQGQIYILRTAFPYQQIEDLTENFKIGLLIFTLLLLLLFNALILFIFNRLTRPIREIISFIKVAEGSDQVELPEIVLTRATTPSDDFQRLAGTFNKLSSRIREKIDDLRAERNEKEAILESLGEGVVAVNEKMETLYINFVACKMLGIVRDNLLEKSFQADGREVNRELMDKTRNLLSYCQMERNIATDSHVFGEEGKTYLDLIAAPKARGTGAIVVLQDKTQHYRLLEMGKDFVANASHELRTPITIIKGYAETLHDIPNLAREKYIEITEKITRSCLRMENLIHSLLTLTDIENILEDRFAQIELTSLVENCCHTICSIYSDARVTIDAPDKKILISADSGLLELALINLLDNGAKYSEPPAQIAIEITPNLKGEMMIAIADKGRGIPKGDIEYIFHRFYRVDKTHSRRLGGAGLGLSIVKTIIAKHRGTIEVSSRVGEGTTVTVILPLHHPHHRDENLDQGPRSLPHS